MTIKEILKQFSLKGLLGEDAFDALKGSLEDVLDSVYNLASVAVLALAVATVVGIVAVGLLVYYKRRDKFDAFKKYAIGFSTGLALTAAVVMTALKAGLVKYEDGGMSDMLFWPIMALILVVIVGAIAMLILNLFSKKAVKIAGICTATGVLGAFIAIMVVMWKYYGGIAADYPGANLVGMIVSAVVFIAVAVSIFFVGKKVDLSDTRALVYGAIAIALSFALSYAKFFEMPQGGSVTFASLLPLMIYCCMFGTRRGVIMCLIYGVLQAVQDPWILHPMQFLLDYPLAFGMIGISGIFVERKVFKFRGGEIVGFLLGGIAAVCLRYTCHVLSGVFAFADWADLDTYGTAAAYSLAYNSFAFIDMLIALAAGVMLMLSNAFTTQMHRSAAGAVGATEGGTVLNDEDDEFDRMFAQNAQAESSAENATEEASGEGDGEANDKE